MVNAFTSKRNNQFPSVALKGILDHCDCHAGCQFNVERAGLMLGTVVKQVQQDNKLLLVLLLKLLDRRLADTGRGSPVNPAAVISRTPWSKGIVIPITSTLPWSRLVTPGAICLQQASPGSR